MALVFKPEFEILRSSAREMSELSSDKIFSAIRQARRIPSRRRILKMYFSELQKLNVRFWNLFFEDKSQRDSWKADIQGYFRKLTYRLSSEKNKMEKLKKAVIEAKKQVWFEIFENETGRKPEAWEIRSDEDYYLSKGLDIETQKKNWLWDIKQIEIKRNQPWLEDENELNF